MYNKKRVGRRENRLREEEKSDEGKKLGERMVMRGGARRRQSGERVCMRGEKREGCKVSMGEKVKEGRERSGGG